MIARRVTRVAMLAACWPAPWRLLATWRVDGARRQPRHVLHRPGRPVSGPRQRSPARRDSGLAQITVRVPGRAGRRITRRDRAGHQWNVGAEGAPPPDIAAPRARRSRALRRRALVHGADVVPRARRGRRARRHGTAVVPVLALATEQRDDADAAWAGALGRSACFSRVGLLTIIGAAVRESVRAAGRRAGAARRRRARIAVGDRRGRCSRRLLGGARVVECRGAQLRRVGALSPVRRRTRRVRERRRPAQRADAGDRRSALAAAAGQSADALQRADARSRQVDAPVPDARAGARRVRAPPSRCARSARRRRSTSACRRCPPGRYRVYGDIVHESGYAQTLVAAATSEETAADQRAVAAARAPTRTTRGSPRPRCRRSSPRRLSRADGARDRVAARRREARGRRGSGAHVLVRDASGAPAVLEPYMGMIGHVAVASDGRLGVRASASGWQHLDGGAAEVSAEDKVPRSARAAPDGRSHRVDSLRVSEAGAVSTVDSSQAPGTGDDRRIRSRGSALTTRRLFQLLVLTLATLAPSSAAADTADRLLKLIAVPGVAGYEAAVREAIEMLLPAGARVRADNLGNIVIRTGNGSPHTLIVAPLDERGLCRVRDHGRWLSARASAHADAVAPLSTQFFIGQPIEIDTASGRPSFPASRRRRRRISRVPRSAQTRRASRRSTMSGLTSAPSRGRTWRRLGVRLLDSVTLRERATRLAGAHVSGVARRESRRGAGDR